jgi:hypothetical protein
MADFEPRVLDRSNVDGVTMTGDYFAEMKMENQIIGIELDAGCGSFLADNSQPID